MRGEHRRCWTRRSPPRLGAGYRDDVPEPVRGESRLTVTEQTLPRLGQRRRYRTARDIAYAEFGKRNRLDIWRRADLPADARAPVLLHVHGGAWIIGDKEVQGEILLTEMARRGWVGATITYRLSPGATWPEHIVDVKRAIAWTRDTIAEHGGDPSFIAITGGSAGGHLAALCALTAGDPEYQPGFEDADTSVQACVPLYGVYDVADLAASGRREIVDLWERLVIKAPMASDPAAWERASPVARVHAGAPPMFVVHGRNDTLVPVEQARRFVEQLGAVSTQPVAYAELPQAQHAFEVLRSVRGIHTTRAIARFLDVVRARLGNELAPVVVVVVVVRRPAGAAASSAARAPGSRAASSATSGSRSGHVMSPNSTSSRRLTAVMLRGTPSMSGPMGCRPSSRAPARYSGTRWSGNRADDEVRHRRRHPCRARPPCCPPQAAERSPGGDGGEVAQGADADVVVQRLRAGRVDADEADAFGGVGHVDRERHEDGRHLVARRERVTVVGADRHRDGGQEAL